MPFTSIYRHRVRPFTEWVVKDKIRWFQPLEEYSLESIAHLFMTRLKETFKSVMFMPSKYRRKLFELEMKVIEEEQKQHKKK
jgi:hypothetical protein